MRSFRRLRELPSPRLQNIEDLLLVVPLELLLPAYRTDVALTARFLRRVFPDVILQPFMPEIDAAAAVFLPIGVIPALLFQILLNPFQPHDKSPLPDDAVRRLTAQKMKYGLTRRSGPAAA